MPFLLVFIGAGLGGISRFSLSNAFTRLLGPYFPYGTLFVNTLGSFLAGFIFILLLDRLERLALPLRFFLLNGFLGGFTTFSTFSLETLNLLESNGWLLAGLNVLLNIMLCLFMVWLGIWGGRQL